MGAPIQWVYGPQYRNHIQFFFKAFIPGAVRGSYIQYLPAGNLTDYLIGPDQFLPKSLLVVFSQLNMTVCMISD